MHDIEVINKIFFPFAAFLSTFFLMRLHFFRGSESKVLMLEKMAVAIEARDSHTATEIFRLVHGILLDFEQLKCLHRNKQSSQIIAVLKKFPGMVEFVSGAIIYKGRFRHCLARRVVDFSLVLISTFFVFLFCMLAYYFMVVPAESIDTKIMIWVVYSAISFFLMADAWNYRIMASRLIKDGKG